MEKPVRVYTTAPVDYDWGWTKTLAENVAETDRGKPVRLVEIEDRYHADSQIGRYHSGLHLALEEDQFRKHVSYNLATFTPEQEIVHHRMTFDLKPGVFGNAATRSYFRKLILDEHQDFRFTKSPESSYHYELLVVGNRALFDLLTADITALLAGTGSPSHASAGDGDT
jgi:hypothetical protein